MKLSRETKDVMFGIKLPPESNSESTRKFMLHNISAFDFVDNIDNTHSSVQHTDVPQDDTHNTLLANTTNLQDTISPADIRKVLSTTKSNNSSPANNSVPLDNATRTIDGIKYRTCNTHKTYHVYVHQ